MGSRLITFCTLVCSLQSMNIPSSLPNSSRAVRDCAVALVFAARDAADHDRDDLHGALHILAEALHHPGLIDAGDLNGDPCCCSGPAMAAPMLRGGTPRSSGWHTVQQATGRV
jgi:hypothetical protein